MIVALMVGLIGVLLLFLDYLHPWLSCRYFGFCPKCNSDAPKIDTCKVCEGYRSNNYNGNGVCNGKAPLELRKIWWDRYKKLP